MSDAIRDRFRLLAEKFADEAEKTTDAQDAQRWMTAAAIAFDKSQHKDDPSRP